MTKNRIFKDHIPQKSSFVISLTIILLAVSCRIDSDKEVDRGRFSFRTGDDTELFFKNVRQSDYELEVNEAARFHVFRHDKRPSSDTLAWINPAIVINYLQDEAYILLEPSPVLRDLDTLEVLHRASVDTIRLTLPNREQNLEFASRIYEHLKKGDSLLVFTGKRYVPFLPDREHSEAFRIAMSDYYRLTRIF